MLRFPQELKGKVLGHNKDDWHARPYVLSLRDWFKRAASIDTFIRRNQKTKGEARRTGGRARDSGSVVTFDDRDLKLGPPIQDEPMVISVITAKYKVERVLIDQRSSANILY
ncbi:hypothetical protein CR513_36527, partial [Mucuna pruriens]